MVEAMAAANAFLRLKTEDKSLSVSTIYRSYSVIRRPVFSRKICLWVAS